MSRYVHVPAPSACCDPNWGWATSLGSDARSWPPALPVGTEYAVQTGRQHDRPGTVFECEHGALWLAVDANSPRVNGGLVMRGCHVMGVRWVKAGRITRWRHRRALAGQ